MDDPDRRVLLERLKEAEQKVAYYRDAGHQTALLCVREAEQMANVIRALEDTEARLRLEIAERKRAVAKLAESERWYRTLFEETPEGDS